MKFYKNLISVIIPVYNVDQYLKRCLNSVLSNSYTNLEIICVNDGSTDTSKEILQDYAKRDPRIIVVNKENGGVASARNKGLQYAKGEYIAYIDPDDWVHIYYFEHLHKAITEYGADIAICDFARGNDDNLLEKDVGYSSRLMSLEEMMSNHYAKNYVWKRLLRHSFISGIVFDEKTPVEDAVYNMEILLQQKIPQIVYLDEVLYAYFVRDGSLVTKINYYSIFGIAQTLVKKIDKVKEDHIKNILYTEIIKKALSSRYSFLILRDNQNIRDCNAIMRKCFRDYKNTKLWILYKLPWLYRLWMIKQDKTLLVYEKNLKAQK